MAESKSIGDTIPVRTRLRWTAVLVLGLGAIALSTVSDVTPVSVKVFEKSPRTLTSRHIGEKPAKLDFFIAGFEKCGTTHMLHAFENHKETDMVPSEQCYLSSTSRSTAEVFDHLQDELTALSPEPRVKRGIKCPRGLRTLALDRLKEWFPETKILVALRHPVHYFRSFYNFRVSMTHTKHPNITIPPIETLVGSNEWLKVSTDNARFEYDLMHLGKTRPTARYPQRFPQTPFKVLLYSLEQLSDENEERRDHFSRKMADFLDIETPVETGPRKTSRAPQHKFNEYNESIDICESKYNDVRDILVRQARETSRWIRKEFLKSPDVSVINEKHFLESLRAWDYDPCVLKDAK